MLVIWSVWCHIEHEQHENLGQILGALDISVVLKRSRLLVQITAGPTSAYSSAGETGDMDLLTSTYLVFVMLFLIFVFQN